MPTCVPHQDNDKLHLNLLDLEVSGEPWASAEAVQECVTRALAAPLTPHTKILLSQRGLQFAEDHGNSIQRLDVTANLLNPTDHDCEPFAVRDLAVLHRLMFLSSAVCFLCMRSTRDC